MHLSRFVLSAISFFLLTTLTTAVTAQKKIPEEYYVFDKDMKATTVEQAVYFLSVRKIGDTVWQWDTYNFKGPIIRMQTYADHEGKILNGPSYYYTEKGDLDSIAEFKRGIKDGDFFHLESTGTGPHDSLVWKTKYVYKDDQLVASEPVKPTEIKDSAGDKESAYPGGGKKWIAYLSKNLIYPDRAASQGIQGLVRALFTVNTDGTLGNIYIGRSVEYSLDREVERVIRNSGKWIPGSKNGAPIKTWKEQPIALSLQ